MVRQMIGAIGEQIAACRSARWPLTQPVIGLAVGVQQAMRAIMHQDRKPQLPPAQYRQRQRRHQNAGEPVIIPCRRAAKGRKGDSHPTMQHQPDAAPPRQGGDGAPVLCGENVARIGGLYRWHDASMFMQTA